VATGPLAKIDPGVLTTLDALAPGKMVAVIVTLRDQAALGSITATSRAARLVAVVQALKRKAEETQRPLRTLLARRQAEGRVAEATPFWVFNGLAVTATAEVVREIAARPEVLRITPDSSIEAPTAAASLAPAEQNLSVVNAPALWDLGFGGQGIVVANMDTGVDASHPDLGARWRGGTNSWFDPNGQHSTPADASGHGTGTMGVLVGGDAGGSAIGMAPDARWIAVKIFDDRGVATTSGIHQGFQWLLDPDGDSATPDAPHIVSNSWTMGSIGCNLVFQLDLQSLRAASILPVFAAGNFGPDASTSASPANNPEAFAVGATDNADALDAESSQGPSACGEPETIFPELAAPGVQVRTADLFGLYAQRTGTSLAAPHVAGALALLLDAFPDLSADVQEEALKRGAVDLGAPGPDNGTGYGRLDVLASYGWLTSRPDFTIAAAPSSVATIPGGSVSSTVTVTPSSGFGDDVALSLSGLAPSQASWAFTPATVAGGGGSSQLTLTTSASLAPGTYPLTVLGTGASLVHSTPITLLVNPPPDFGLSVSPSSSTVKRNASAAYTVSVSSQGGFVGTVGLSVTGLPSGATATFNPSSVAAPGNSTMTIDAGNRATRGTFTLTVTGQSGSTVHQVTMTLTVK
jgi:subtilisin family serine protease